MRYIITESKMQEIALKWLDKNYGPEKIEIVKSKFNSNQIYYKKDGIVFMELVKRNKDVWFHEYDIWSFFENFFGMSYYEIESILEQWLEKTLKLKGYSANPAGDMWIKTWRHV